MTKKAEKLSPEMEKLIEENHMLKEVNKTLSKICDTYENELTEITDGWAAFADAYNKKLLSTACLKEANDIIKNNLLLPKGGGKF